MTDKLFCHHCGKPLVQSARFCSYCGSAIPANNDMSDDSKIVEEKPVLSNEEKQQTNKLCKNKSTSKYYLPVNLDDDACIRQILLEVINNENIPVNILDSLKKYDKKECYVTFCKYIVRGSAQWNATLYHVNYREVPTYDNEGRRTGTKTEHDYVPYNASGECSFDTSVFLPAVKLDDLPLPLKNAFEQDLKHLTHELRTFDAKDLNSFDDNTDTNIFNSQKTLTTIPLRDVWETFKKQAIDTIETAVDNRVNWSIVQRSGGDKRGNSNYKYSYKESEAIPMLFPFKIFDFTCDGKCYSTAVSAYSGSCFNVFPNDADTAKQKKELDKIQEKNENLIILSIVLLVIFGLVFVILSICIDVAFMLGFLVLLIPIFFFSSKKDSARNKLKALLLSQKITKLKKVKELYGTIWNQELENMLIAEQSKIASKSQN